MRKSEHRFTPIPPQEQIDTEYKIDWFSCFCWFGLVPAIWIAVVIGSWKIGVWIGRWMMGG